MKEYGVQVKVEQTYLLNVQADGLADAQRKALEEIGRTHTPAENDAMEVVNIRAWPVTEAEPRRARFLGEDDEG